MCSREGNRKFKGPGLGRSWSAQDAETRPVRLRSPAFYPARPCFPSSHWSPCHGGAMSQDIGFMLFSASNKILPGSNSEAPVWRWWNSIFHFTLQFMGSQLAEWVQQNASFEARGKHPNTHGDPQGVEGSFFLWLNLFVGKSQNCFPGKSDEIITAEV